MDHAAWIDAYFAAWRERDPDAAAALFTEDALYRSHPCEPAHVGHDGIRAYWAGATSAQTDIELRVGEPLGGAGGVAVEWWVTLRIDGELATIPGCLLLRFAQDGRCIELREYWNYTPGGHEPPPGWGEY